MENSEIEPLVDFQDEIKSLVRFETEKKSIAAAFLLAIYFGLVGGHDYYLGDIGKGILKLIFTITVIGILVSFILLIIDFFSLPARVREKNRILAHMVFPEFKD